jgi:hypothetical protein
MFRPRSGAAGLIALALVAACSGGDASPRAASASGSPLAPAPGYWFSTIDGGNTGTAAVPAVPLGPAVQPGGYCHSGDNGPTGNATTDAVQQQWNYWDQCGLSAVSAAAEGIAPPPNGDTVLRWDKPKGFSQVLQKLNREFIAPGSRSAPFPAGPPNEPIAYTTSPADVSGRYIVNQYIDSAHTDLTTGHAWVFLQEFKENYTDATGAGRQDPYWGFGCDDLADYKTATCSMTGGKHNVEGPRINMTTISDRWVTFEYRLYQGARDDSGRGGRIELWIDGKLFDTGYEDQMHVGSAGYSPLDKTYSWIWIAGQYTSNQTTDGVPDYQNIAFRSYVDGSQVLPLPATRRPGLSGAYFSNRTLTGAPVLSRVDPAVNFSWGRGSPGAGVPVDNFSARWSGYVTPPTTGTYYLCTRTDDGSRVWLNGTKVIDSWVNQGGTVPRCGPARTMTAGVPVPVKVEYYEATGAAVAALGYKTSATGADMQVPAEWLSY